MESTSDFVVFYSHLLRVIVRGSKAVQSYLMSFPKIRPLIFQSAQNWIRWHLARTRSTPFQVDLTLKSKFLTVTLSDRTPKPIVFFQTARAPSFARYPPRRNAITVDFTLVKIWEVTFETIVVVTWKCIHLSFTKSDIFFSPN